MLLTGAFASAAGVFYSGHVWAGAIAALVAGGLVGLLHAYLCVTLRVDQLVSGLAINLATAGLTAFWARVIFATSSVQQLQGFAPIGISSVERYSYPWTAPVRSRLTGLLSVSLSSPRYLLTISQQPRFILKGGR